jgi:hypothetical protein
MYFRIKPFVSLIDSTINHGLSSSLYHLPFDVRSALVKNVLNSGITNVEVGDMKCTRQLHDTKNILYENRDILYGMKTLSASIHSISDINKLVNNGGDEIILNINVNNDIDYIYLSKIVNYARFKNLKIRCSITNIFTKENICDDIDKLIEIIIHLSRINIKYFSIIDDNNCIDSIYVDVLQNKLKMIVYPEQIAFGFNNNSVENRNVYTSICNGFYTFHVSLNNLGHIYATQRMVKLLDYFNLDHSVSNKQIMNDTGKWLKQQLTYL